MSSGENTGKLPSAVTTEDFSSPANELEEGGVSRFGVDILDLIFKFQILGPDTEAVISKLREELSGQPERLQAGALVERGYLAEEELDSMVLARYLLACGKVTMPQLELVMDEIKDTKAPLWVALVAKGWLKMSDVV